MIGRILERRRRREPRPGKLRILHVFSYFRPDFTGEGLYFEKIEPILESQGIANSVLVLATVQSDAPRSRSGGDGKAASFPVEYLAKSKIGALKISTSLFSWAIRHARHYHVAHFHSHGDRYFLGKIALRLLGCRIVQSCTLDDSPAELISSYSWPFRAVAAVLMRIVDLFIVISPRLTTSARAMLPRDRVRFIPQGVALPAAPERDRGAERHRLGFAPDDMLLLFVGAVTARKDVLFLVEAMPRLRQTIPDLKLVVVGPVFDDEYGARFTARIAELGLADSVRLVGYIDDPGPYFRSCDIFVFASHQEGFGNVIIEAMAYRLPVVARLLPGVTDYIIETGATGYLFSAADEYFRFVERLAADPARRRAIGNAARIRVEQSFDLGKIAAEYSATYASVARRSVGAPSPSGATAV
jgi:glycosyltransferase involved in cell wall biosynthesis